MLTGKVIAADNLKNELIIPAANQHHLVAAKGGYTLKNLFSGKTLQPLNGEAKAGVAMEE
jgi:hypothetical protein